MQTLLPSARGAAGELMRAQQIKCTEAVIDAARSLVVGDDKHGTLFLLELSDEGERAVRSACVGSVTTVDRVKVEGADEAYAREHDVVVFEPGVVLMGRKHVVEAALAGKGTAFPKELTLAGEQQVKWVARVHRPADVAIAGSFNIGKEALGLRTVLDFSDEGMAQQLEGAVTALRGQAAAEIPEEHRQEVAPLLDAVKVQRNGKQVVFTFDVQGGAVTQAAVLGTVASLGIYGVRRYITQAKTAEARNALGEIGKDYVTAWYGVVEIMGKPSPTLRKGKKLLSLPAVPATIPKGVKYQSSPDDWKAWESIKFSMSEPQYYQYEIIAAKDGKSAVIYARGDLDGDGTPSEFRLPVHFEPKDGTLLLGPSLEESNPTE